MLQILLIIFLIYFFSKLESKKKKETVSEKRKKKKNGKRQISGDGKNLVRLLKEEAKTRGGTVNSEKQSASVRKKSKLPGGKEPLKKDIKTGGDRRKEVVQSHREEVRRQGEDNFRGRTTFDSAEEEFQYIPDPEDRDLWLEGIILSEILDKPKALR